MYLDRDPERGYYDHQSDNEFVPRSNTFNHDDFDEMWNESRVVRTGRQRKKLAARSKGGEFQAKRKKRRVYFACISKEIDLEKLQDHLDANAAQLNPPEIHWQYTYASDVLRLFRAAPSQTNIKAIPIQKPFQPPIVSSSIESPPLARQDSQDEDYFNDQLMSASYEGKGDTKEDWEEYARRELSISTGQEIFIFDFGVAVFWGLSRGEERKMLEVFRLYATSMISPEEFKCGEDDMAFVTSPEIDSISISNDVINIHDTCPPKQRLAVSFAIAQSTMLSIFEARIERMVEEYKFIPEVISFKKNSSFINEFY